MSTGIQKFKQGLEACGIETHEVKADNGEVGLSIKFKIEGGKFKGQYIRVAFIVPSDFELSPPTGPHISPRLIPIRPDGPDHKTRAHESPFGPKWQYLSRPVPVWENRSVKAYIKYVSHLLNTL